MAYRALIPTEYTFRCDEADGADNSCSDQSYQRESCRERVRGQGVLDTDRFFTSPMLLSESESMTMGLFTHFEPGFKKIIITINYVLSTIIIITMCTKVVYV